MTMNLYEGQLKSEMVFPFWYQKLTNFQQKNLKASVFLDRDFAGKSIRFPHSFRKKRELNIFCIQKRQYSCEISTDVQFKRKFLFDFLFFLSWEKVRQLLVKIYMNIEYFNKISSSKCVNIKNAAQFIFYLFFNKENIYFYLDFSLCWK